MNRRRTAVLLSSILVAQATTDAQFVSAQILGCQSAQIVPTTVPFAPQYAPVTTVQYAPVTTVQYAPVTAVQYPPVTTIQYAPTTTVQYAPTSTVQYAPPATVRYAPTTTDYLSWPSVATTAQIPTATWRLITDDSTTVSYRPVTTPDDRLTSDPRYRITTRRFYTGDATEEQSPRYASQAGHRELVNIISNNGKLYRAFSNGDVEMYDDESFGPERWVPVK